MKQFAVETSSRSDLINITDSVRTRLRELELDNGILTVFVPHTTAGITINENADPDVVSDMKTVLNKIVPWNDNYRHAEGNTAAHIKASLMGSSAQIIVEEGALQLGTWQGIFLCDFDGPRTRQVWVSAQ